MLDTLVAMGVDNKLGIEIDVSISKVVGTNVGLDVGKGVIVDLGTVMGLDVGVDLLGGFDVGLPLGMVVGSKQEWSKVCCKSILVCLLQFSILNAIM